MTNKDMTYTDTEKQLIKVLRPGIDNPITGRDIERLTGITSRNVRALCTPLTNKGVPIGSRTDSPGGYYIINTNAEKMMMLERLYAQRRGLDERIEALEDCEVE